MKRKILTNIAIFVIYPIFLLIGLFTAIPSFQKEEPDLSTNEKAETSQSVVVSKLETTVETQKQEILAEKEESSPSVEKKTLEGTTIHVDAVHSNIGRLFNLWQVKESLNGKKIKYGKVFSYNREIELSMSSLKFMYGEAFTSSGVAPAGGVCGGSSALAGEVDRIGKDLIREDDGGRHPVSYHSSGGIYYNLPNVAVFFDGKKHTDLRVINTNPEIDYEIIIKTNYDDLWEEIGIDLENWQVSAGRWDEFLSPKEYTVSDEFQFKISLIEIEKEKN